MASITTLKQRSDFLRLRRGRKFASGTFILRALPAEDSTSSATRVGYTVTTKCGNAVIRNRIKRRLRALVRELFPMYARSGHDYLFVALDTAKPNAATIAFAELRAAMEKAIQGIHR